MEKSNLPRTDSGLSKQDRQHLTNQIQAASSANLPVTLVSKHVAAKALDVGVSTLKHYRKHFWIEGIHYFRLSPKSIRYGLELVVDWAIHRSDQQAHQRAIEAFLLKLESNQPKKRRPKG